jgi:DNA-binding transcriptional LysR family regulator
MKDVNWDDIRVFRLVAELGSLSGASRRCGISAATVGRKIQRLERKLGSALFEKTQTGYLLTSFGRQLHERTRSMAITASELSIWRDQVLDLPLISIAAAPEIQWVLSRNIRELWAPEDAFRISFEEAVLPRHLEHEKSTLLITSTRPESGNLKVSQIGVQRERAYCCKGFDQVKDCNWIGYRPNAEAAVDHHLSSLGEGAWVTIWASSFEGLVALVQSGAGRAVLPNLIGDADEGLVVAEGLNPASSKPLFLVSHDDESGRSEITTLKRRLEKLLKTSLMQG